MISQVLKKETLQKLFQKYGKSYKADEIIFNEDDKPDYFYIIYRGKVKIVLHGTVLNTLGDGEIFGEMAVIDGEGRTGSAVTLTDTDVIELDKSMFETMVDDEDFAGNLLKIMIYRISRLSDMSAKLLRRKERTRILVSLSNLIRPQLNKNKEPIKLELKKVILRISIETKIDREVIIKHFKDMELNNTLEISEDSIIVRNSLFLRKSASGEILTDWII